MRNHFLFSLFLLMFWGNNVVAQHLLPSTVREIYNFSVGDTFMYEITNYSASSSGSCNSFEQNITQIVLEKETSLNGDSIIYKFEILSEYKPFYCNVSYSQYTVSKVYTDLDSFIVPEPSFDTCYWYYQNLNCSNCYIDTNFVFIDNDFEIRPLTLWTDFSFDFDSLHKINCSIQYNCGWDFKEKVYADNLGLIYRTIGQEGEGTYIEELVYYHKANGEVWGTPYYFDIIKGVDDKDPEPFLVTVFPNPVKDGKVEITVPKGNEYNLQFSLFDVTGKQIDTRTIQTEKSTFIFNNLPHGMYYWNILSEGKILQTGKLVF